MGGRGLGVRVDFLPQALSSVISIKLFVCLFVLRLNVPVNNFSVMSGRITSVYFCCLSCSTKDWNYNFDVSFNKTKMKNICHNCSQIRLIIFNRHIYMYTKRVLSWCPNILNIHGIKSFN